MARTNTAYPDNWQNPGSQRTEGPFFPAGSGEAFQNAKLLGYLPVLFSEDTQLKFWDLSLLTKIVNVRYEAKLKQAGEKIYIPKRPSVTVKEIQEGEKIDYQRLSAEAPIEFTIDHNVGWAYKVDDLTTQMTHVKDYISLAQEEALHAMQDYIEPLVINSMIDEIAAANQGTTAGVVSKSLNLGTPTSPITLQVGDASATNVLADLYCVLQEQKVFSKGAKPWCVVQPRFLNVLAKSSLSAANISGDSNPLVRRGQESVGVVQGLELYSTNYLHADDTTPTSFPILVGTTDFMTYAMTVQQAERLRAHDEYADIYRGRSVFGFKAIQPECAAVAWVKYAS